MTRRTLSAVAALTAGVLFGTLTAFLGTVGLVITAVCCAAILIGSRVYGLYALPGRSHRALLAELDPEAGPPAGAQPAVSDLFDRMQAAARAGDWDGLKALLAADFHLVDARGRRRDAKSYVRTLQLMHQVYPDLRSETEAIMVDPAAPHTLWLRSSTLGHPRRGPAMDCTSWSRLTTTHDGRLARELASGGVTRVA